MVRGAPICGRTSANQATRTSSGSFRPDLGTKWLRNEAPRLSVKFFFNPAVFCTSPRALQNFQPSSPSIHTMVFFVKLFAITCTVFASTATKVTFAIRRTFTWASHGKGTPGSTWFGALLAGSAFPSRLFHGPYTGCKKRESMGGSLVHRFEYGFDVVTRNSLRPLRKTVPLTKRHIRS